MLTDIAPTTFRSLNPWRRRDALADFQRSMSRMMRDFFEEEPALLSTADWTDGNGAFVPRLDMQETEDKITLSAELPGMSDKDVEVSLDKEYLTIKGEKKEEKESKSAGRCFTERSYGSFERTLRLPTSVEKDKISAKFDKGVLTVEVPKSLEAKKEVKRIPIKH
jgi:HSP20 family protein